MTPFDVSVVIPAIDEVTVIAASIESARRAGAGEVIVVDGGSSDETLRAARDAGATKVVRSLPGRGIQLNSGALMVEREYVLFLHADNVLDKGCLQQICDCGDPVWGAFRQRIDSARAIYRWIEWGNALRVTYRRMPFGDQGVFVRKDAFDREGRFNEIPLMEDVEFARRMRRLSKPVLLPGPLTINARRWQDRGVVRQTLRNWSIQLAYKLGASPRRLEKWYR